MPQVCIIHSSVANRSDAEQIARSMLDKRLAACVQISGPGISLYRWQGNIEQSEEWFLQIKTTPACRPQLIHWLEKHHPYQTPELIWSHNSCTQTYADWLAEVVVA